LTQIFFYHGAADKIAAICDLLAKAAAQNKPVLVYAPEPGLAAEIDRFLWVRPPTGFVPHCLSGSPLASQTPIVITQSLKEPLQDERLMNLGREVPQNFSRFSSLIELVGEEEEDRRAGRERARFYKDRGYEVKFINLGAAA